MNQGELIQATILYWCFGFVVGVAVYRLGRTSQNHQSRGGEVKPVVEKFKLELSLNEKQARWLRSQAALDEDTVETTANVFLRLAINQQIEQARRFPNGNLSK